MQFSCVEIFQNRRDLVPGLKRSLVLAGILCRTILHGLIKQRLAFSKNDKVRLLFLRNITRLEPVSSETTIVLSYTCSVFHVASFFVILEVVFQFLFEHSLLIRITYISPHVVIVVHVPSSLKSNSVIALEVHVAVQYKVVKVIRRFHHCKRNVIVIRMRIRQI